MIKAADAQKDRKGHRMADDANMIDLKSVCVLLKLSPRRVQQLATQKWIPRAEKGKYPLVGSVQGYIDFLRDENERRTRSAADSRLRDARAREVEQRIAERDKGLIDVDEALTAADRLAGVYLSSITGLPARITRNQSERRRLEGICDNERQRVADMLSEIASDLRASRNADAAGSEVDAG